MKKLLLAFALVLSSTLAQAQQINSVEVEFPRKMECFDSKELGSIIGGKYREKVLIAGNTMNAANDKQALMILTYNLETKSYTYIVEYKTHNLACVIDSGLAEINIEAILGKVDRM